MKSKLILRQFQHIMLWLSYNHPTVTVADVDTNLEADYVKATKLKGNFCKCKDDKPKAVNHLWDDWHCTYCLKPKKNN